MSRSCFQGQGQGHLVSFNMEGFVYSSCILKLHLIKYMNRFSYIKSVPRHLVYDVNDNVEVMFPRSRPMTFSVIQDGRLCVFFVFNETAFYQIYGPF